MPKITIDMLGNAAKVTVEDVDGVAAETVAAYLAEHPVDWEQATKDAKRGDWIREDNGTADLHVPPAIRQQLLDFGWTPPVEDGD